MLVATAVGSALPSPRSLAAVAAARDDDAAGAAAADRPGDRSSASTPSRGEVVRRIPAGRTPSAVAVGGGALWLVDADARTVLRVVPSSRVVETLATGATPTDIAFGAGSVWVANGRRLPDTQFIGPVATAVARLDPTTRTERAAIGLPRDGRLDLESRRQPLAVLDGRASGPSHPDFSVVRSTRRTGAITRDNSRRAARRRSPTGGPASGCSASTARSSGSTSVPAASCDGASNPPARSDRSPSARNAAGSRRPRTGRCGGSAAGAPSRSARSSSRLASPTSPSAPNGVWVANPIAGTLTQRRPGDGATSLRTIDLDGIPRSVAIDGDTVWVAVIPDPVASRGVRRRRRRRPSRRTCASRRSAGERRRRTCWSSRTCRCRAASASARRRWRRRSRSSCASKASARAAFRVAYQSCDDSIAQHGALRRGEVRVQRARVRREPGRDRRRSGRSTRPARWRRCPS